jgi:hypothetical protein
LPNAVKQKEAPEPFRLSGAISKSIRTADILSAYLLVRSSATVVRTRGIFVLPGFALSPLKQLHLLDAFIQFLEPLFCCFSWNRPKSQLSGLPTQSGIDFATTLQVQNKRIFLPSFSDLLFQFLNQAFANAVLSCQQPSPHVRGTP